MIMQKQALDEEAFDIICYFGAAVIFGIFALISGALAQAIKPHLEKKTGPSNRSGKAPSIHTSRNLELQ